LQTKPIKIEKIRPRRYIESSEIFENLMVLVR
jgi:hypothetical protein